MHRILRVVANRSISSGRLTFFDPPEPEETLLLLGQVTRNARVHRFDRNDWAWLRIVRPGHQRVGSLSTR